MSIAKLTGETDIKNFTAGYAGYLYVAAASIIWGANGVIVNLVPADAFVIAFFRVLIGSLALLPLVFLTRKTEALRAAKSWRTILSLGISLAFGWALIFHAMKLIPIANAVLLNYMAPVYVALLAPLLLKEKFEKSTLLALVISLAGIVVILFQQDLQISNFNLLGVVLGLLAGISYAGYIIISKRALSSFSSPVVAFYSYIVAAVFLLPFVIGEDLSLDATSWLLMLALGVFNTALAVTIYLKGLGMVKASRAVVISYIEPACAVLFGFLFLEQSPTLLMLLGGALVLVAGYLVASK